MNIINGKEIAKQLRQDTKLRVEQLKENHGIIAGLAVILVGDNPASQVYVRNKEKMTLRMGMNSYPFRLKENTAEDEVLDLIDKLNKDDNVHGILLQLPLPKHLDEDKIIGTIDPNKDADGLHINNLGKIMAGIDGVKPCTPFGCIKLLESLDVDLSGKNAIVIGRSNLVGKPIAQLLLQKNATVTMAHSRTKDLPNLCNKADIIIAAVGVAELIKSNWVKKDAIIIDVGINRLDDGSLVGDVDFNEVKEIASHITPVPGGVGPMTIACLLSNTCDLAELSVN